MLKEELQKLSKWIFQISWDLAIRTAHLQCQLQSAQAEVSGLELVFSFRELRWEFAVRMVKLQDELRWARGKISNLKCSSKSKSAATYLKARGLSLAIIPISVRSPPIESYTPSGGRPSVGAVEESGQPSMVPCWSNHLSREGSPYVPRVGMAVGSKVGLRRQSASAHQFGQQSRLQSRQLVKLSISVMEPSTV